MKTTTEIIDTRDKDAWNEYLLEAKKNNERRPLMARGYAGNWDEHETHDFHLNK